MVLERQISETLWPLLLCGFEAAVAPPHPPSDKILRAHMLVAVCTNAHFADKLVIEYDKLNIQVSHRDRCM